MGFVSANGYLTPRYSGNNLTYIADYLRKFDDILIFRLATGIMHRPIGGFHGELMIVKGAILREIGFDRYTITEDFDFAREMDRRNYKVWQSDTQVSVLSPLTAQDLIRQRNRWYRGLSRDIWKGATPGMWCFAGLRILTSI